MLDADRETSNDEMPTWQTTETYKRLTEKCLARGLDPGEVARVAAVYLRPREPKRLLGKQ